MSGSPPPTSLPAAPLFDFDQLMREIRDDEAVEPASKRKLTQEEILRLVQVQRAKQRPSPPGPVT